MFRECTTEEILKIINEVENLKNSKKIKLNNKNFKVNSDGTITAKRVK